jgi:hypothetical protein
MLWRIIAFSLVASNLLAASCIAPPVVAANLGNDSQQLAVELKLIPVIDRIGVLQTIPEKKRTLQETIELIHLQQQLDYRLTLASLEINDVLAEIDSEDARSEEIRFTLESKRDRAQRLNSLANLAGSGGLGIVSSSVGIGANNVGNIIGVTAATVNATLAGASYRAQGDERNSIRRERPRPNMLAQLFDKPHDEAHSFPDCVWTYLNRPPEGEKTTRRQSLIDMWVQLGRIPPPQTPQGQREIGEISGTLTSPHNITINTLQDRSAMLSDLRASIFKMSRLVLKLMLAINHEEDAQAH